ncbi:MAG TPA: hypothetical protein VIM07_00835 [Chitinophagaceae bacterium]
MAVKEASRPITSGDIAFAREGEKPMTVAFESDSDQVTNWAIQDNMPTTEQKFVIFKLCDNTKQGGVHLPNEDDAVNPETGKVERLRLLSGIDDVWMKKQKDLSPEYVKANRRTLTFPRGAKILRIPESDKAALEFLTLCNYNIGNQKRKTGARYEFFEYNPAKQEEESLKKEMLEIEMAIQASKEPEESMRKHAFFLGVQMFDEYGMPKTVEGIRSQYILMAKRQPQKFKKTLGSKEVEISYLIKKAISENLIDLGGHSGNVAWGAGGFIAKVPIGRNTHEYLVELALNTSDDGKRFLSQLQDVNKK